MSQASHGGQQADADKPIYAPLPARAIADRRLSEGLLRVLAAVAAHDRLNANKQGCWTSHKRLAELTGYSIPHVNEYLSALAQRGYLAVSRGNDDRRRRVYRVIYTDDDRTIMKRDGSSAPEASPTESGPIRSEMVPACGNDGPEIVPDATRQRADFIETITQNIFRETGIDTAKREIHSPEGAPSRDSAVCKRKAPVAPVGVYSPTVGANLAQFERHLKAQEGPSRKWLVSWQPWLEAVAAEFEGDDSVSHGPRAQRLLEEVELRLHGDAA